MSHESIGFCNCPEIQDALNSYFTTCDPTKIMGMAEIGLVAFLNSPVNRSGIIQRQISTGRGKKRILELEFTPRILPSEIGTSSVRQCNSGTNYGNQCETYEMGDDHLSADWRFRIEDLADTCKDNPQWVEDSILNHMNAMVRRLDQEYSTRLTTLNGDFANGETGTNPANDLKTVNTQDAAGDFDRNLIREMEFASKNMSYCTIPYVIGWNETDKYFNEQRAGCCADEGIDIGEFSRGNPSVFIPDVNIETDFGANHFITMAAGATQPLFYTEFEGPEGTNSFNDESYIQGVLTHPSLGIPFNFLFNVDCGVLSYQLRINWDLVGMPAGMFFAGDRLTDVTFVNDYVIVNP